MSQRGKNTPSRTGRPLGATEGAWRAKLPAVLSDVRGRLPGKPEVTIDSTGERQDIDVMADYQPPVYLKAACRLHRLSYDTLRDAMARDPDLKAEVEEARAIGMKHCLTMAALDSKNSRHWAWCAERYDREELHLPTKVTGVDPKDGGAPITQIVRFPVNELGNGQKR